jgi:prepilin-type N-terminal cleavage/methylation domain-containing protein
MSTSLLKNSSGFTLMEILISITIISLIGITFYPNLKRFNSDQQFQNEVLNIKNNIKKAQNMYTTGTRCGNGKAATAWSVTIAVNSTNLTNLKAYCINDTLTTSSNETFPATPASNITYSSSNCAIGTTAIELKFDKNGLSYSCNGGTSFTSGPFSITYLNKNASSQSTTILISQLGNISQN